MTPAETTLTGTTPGGKTLGAALATLIALGGCNGFFTKPTNTGGGGGTGNTGDFAYVSNGATGASYLAGYNLAAGTLAAVPGSPYNLGYVPAALSVAPGNGFLYAASTPDASSPGIYVYAIGSNGSLSAINSGAPAATDTVASMAISVDGNWLFSVNVTGSSMNQYRINTVTGALTLATSLILPGIGCVATGGSATPVTQTCAVSAGPAGTYVAVALGTAGTVVFPYTSAAGITSAAYIPVASGSTAASPSGDFSVALDKNAYAYIARTGTLAVYAVSATAATLAATATFPPGTVPRSTLLGTGYNYVYTANQGTGTISGFAIGSSGTLAEVADSPFSAPPSVSALALDNTGKYVVAAGYGGTAGVQLYAVGTGGTLSPQASAPSGKALTYPIVLALTR